MSAAKRLPAALAAFLCGCALFAGHSPRAAASDFGAFIEYAALRRFAVDPGERTLARACNDRCTFSTRGTRWGFLNRYDEAGRRTWRSPPIPIQGCTGATLSSWGPWKEGFNQLDLGRCPAGRDNLWLWLPDNRRVSMRAEDREPASTSREPLQVGSALHVHGPATASLAETQALLSTRWQKVRPSHDTGFVLEVAYPVHAQALAGAPADLAALETAHAQTSRLWRTASGRTDARAIRAVDTMEPLISTIDWWSLPDSAVGRMNDTGFWLQQTGRCDDAADAIVLLEEVVRRAPERASAWLNLTEAQAQTRTPQCQKDSRRSVASEVAIRENARRYCTAQGIHRIPSNIARRLAALLEVPRLDAQVCRPRGDVVRAVFAKDATALQRALHDHPEDLSEPAAGGYLPLFEAVQSGWLEGARQLLAAGADPDRARPSEDTSQFTPTPLVQAIYGYDVPMVQLLLQHRADPNPFRNPPLLVAAGLWGTGPKQEEATRIVQALLDAGANPRAQNEDRETALMKAASGGNLAAMEILLAKGGDSLLNLTDKYGRNALHHVPPFSDDRTAAWTWLLQHGGNLNQQDISGDTPLLRLFAWSGRKPEVIAAMIEQAMQYRPDLQLSGPDGQTVLHRAAGTGNLRAVRALLSAGAPHCPRDRDNRTPADWANKSVTNLQAYGPCAKDAMCPQLQDLRAIGKELGCPASDK